MAQRTPQHQPAAKRTTPREASGLAALIKRTTEDVAAQTKAVTEALAQSKVAFELATQFDSVFATLFMPQGTRLKSKVAARSQKVFVMLEEVGRLTFNQDVAAMLAAQPIPAAAIRHWFDATGLERRKDLFQALHVHPSTLSRAGPMTEMDSSVTERMLRHSDLLVRAAEVFGEEGKTWLTKPHDLLDGKSPMEFAGNEFGAAKVRAMLNAIEYGGVV